MSNLLTKTITVAQAAQLGGVLALPNAPERATLHANFVYGSGGTSVDAWVQTSLDDGASWVDVANFHFTTSSARAVFNLSAHTVVTTQHTPTDGSIASNTAKDGIIGQKWRVKYTTVGTYAGNTSLAVDLVAGGSRS